MKISILMAVHGPSPFLEDTLASLGPSLSQDSEIVIVLDRAEPGAVKLIDQFRDDYSGVVLVTSSVPGLASALNRGLGSCKGEYVARIDSDDILMEGRLRRQAVVLDRNANIVAVGCQVTFIDQSGQTTGRSNFPLFSWQCSRELELWNPLAHPTIMFRRSALVQVGGYREDMMFGQDFELLRRIRKVGKLCNLGFFGVKYRVHPEQVSAKNIKEKIPLITEIVFPSWDKSFSPQEARRIVELYSYSTKWTSMLKALILYAAHRPVSGLIILMSKALTIFGLSIHRAFSRR